MVKFMFMVGPLVLVTDCIESLTAIGAKRVRQERCIGGRLLFFVSAVPAKKYPQVISDAKVAD